jgi:hypothetical protein
MKDSELREMFASVNAALKQGIEDAEQRRAAREQSDSPDAPIMQRLNRIQECVEAGRRFEKLELPSARVPLFVGIVVGAMIFAAGVFVGTFIR